MPNLNPHTFDKTPAEPGLAEHWPKLKLSPPQRQAWDETRAAFLWNVPAYADIFYAMMADKDGELAWFTDQVPTCATDDKLLFVNPEFFFKLTMDERIFVLCHEVAHAMFGHAGLHYTIAKMGFIDYTDGVRLPVEGGKMLNCAADYVINDQLVGGGIGKMPEGGLHCPRLNHQPFITGDMSVLDAYRKLYQENKRSGGGGKRQGQQSQGQSQGDMTPGVSRSTNDQGQDMGAGSGTPSHPTLQPGQGRGKTANKAMSERSQSQWDTAIQAAMEGARLKGDLPENLQRIFTARLQPKADWRDLYMLAVSRKVGNDRYTWGHMDQQLAYRHIGAPGRSTYACGLIVIAMDTSGSINQRTLDVFLAETGALLEQAKPKRIILVQCDAEVHEWREVDGNHELEAKIMGGGGTDFRPVFDRIDSEGETPDMLVYLTDGWGDFPDGQA